jgi:integrase
MPAEHIDTVVFLATTGCRIGEVFAARWGDLGREGRRPVLRVRTAKTAAGLRTLPLTPEMARRLTKRRASATYAADTDPIFPSATGTPMSVHNWRKRIFRPACVTAGLPRATPHQLRHGLASLMAEQGYSAAEIAAQLGHADRGVTALRWYVRPKLHAAPTAADVMVRRGTRVATQVATRQPNLTETG